MSRGPAAEDADVSLYLHAELLPNIRQITLYISLPQTPALTGIQPEIQLSGSRKAVTVTLHKPFDHVSETIKLPTRVSDATWRTLNAKTAPSAPSKPGQSTASGHDYSFRMQIDPSEQASAPRDELTDDHVPWTAADMSSSTCIRCRACGTAFLNESILQESSVNEGLDTHQGWVWKDLPSGNWAEMMDFWHCHKPDPHEDDTKDEATIALRIEEQNAQVKGYGASSRVEAIPGNVLIDVATFLLAESDCAGLKKSSEEESKSASIISGQRTLECEKCNSIIGMEDPSANGWRLLKANVSLNTGKDSEESWTTHSIEVIVAAQLLELIERESARRFVVHCGKTSGLLLWVFNPHLRYSNSSSGHSVNDQQAMKVFYQEKEDVDKLLAPEIGQPSPLSVEELELPSMIFQALSDTLHRSSQMLPISARKFNEWQVGLLSRFSREKATSTLQQAHTP
ncbi:uncharacterized protein N7498_001631 [Penicillium cinerascens]|uniref:Ubiquitin-conjugating enzyme E2-binding protein n=1 Tax=Penicillium cinerascens TaxID=70096 RepID=A0A9W9TAG8_9EURO|nr:uncharacterized protein N7498_001631 [Penicillium cinerascens]KAJ5215224.1 hypothetical protein N7498_001631 [Penicillium cinerascens]